MSKIIKIISSLALSSALCLSMAPAAFAVDTAVTFEGYEITIDGTGSYTTSDLFDGFKNVMPGDVREQNVVMSNEHDNAVKVYMRAEAHGDENPLTYSETYENADGKDQGQNASKGDFIGGEGQRDETVTTMIQFLSQLTMEIKNDGETIYKYSPDQEGSLERNVLLGELAPGESLTLSVNLEVPKTLGNEFAYRVGEVDWVFTVEEIDEPLPDTGLSQTGDGMPIVQLVSIGLAALVVVLIAARFMRRKA